MKSRLIEKWQYDALSDLSFQGNWNHIKAAAFSKNELVDLLNPAVIGCHY